MSGKRAVHFGAGNIGRGFIGMVLSQNGFHVDFVDINEVVIDALRARHGYDISFASEKGGGLSVRDVDGINNKTNPQDVVRAVAAADLVTTAIGPKVLPFIAPLVAQGIAARRTSGEEKKLDVIACENMIGGSFFLGSEVKKHLSTEDAAFAEGCIGFPNAAVDGIVPAQKHEDPLLVKVEPFHEWVVDESQMKNPGLRLEGVHYAEKLDPFIERKLFTVNTGHATVAYLGAYYGKKTIREAIADEAVLTRLKGVLAETGALITAKWGLFDRAEHQRYIDTVIGRFQNPYIDDDVARVARTPIRKLGYDERFIRPIRELRERGLSYRALLETVAYVLVYREDADEESVTLGKMLAGAGNGKSAGEVLNVIKKITGLQDGAFNTLVHEIGEAYDHLKR